MKTTKLIKKIVEQKDNGHCTQKLKKKLKNSS